MIGQTALTHGDRSVTAAVSTALSTGAIAVAVAGEDDTGIPGSAVLPRSSMRLALWPAGDTEQAGNRRAQHKDPNHPDENLAQIPAPSAVDTLKGNRR